MSILEVSGLRKVYTSRLGGSRVEALRNVSFTVEQGEYVAIMGESGSGKTTLLNILAALDEPTAGLDPQGRDAILAQIQAYHRAKGAAVVLVSHSMEEIACNVDRILVLRGSHVYMDGTPRQVFRRADDLEDVGLDVPQATKIALALRRMGLEIDTAVYTVDELEQALLSVRGEAGVC